jgi:hypothetical protein
MKVRAAFRRDSKGESRMRAFIALLTVLALTLAVQAQGRHGKRQSNSDQTSSKPRGDDSAYKKALSSVPDKKYDPWGGVR